MILTKKHFEAFGFKNVIDTIPTPVAVVCRTEVVAQTYSYDSLEELKNEAWFKDALIMNDSPILLYPYPPESDKSDKLIFRMFVAPNR